MKQRILIFSFLALLNLMFLKCQSSNSNGLVTQSPTSASQLYTENCAGCHGNQLQHFKKLKTSQNHSVKSLAAVIKNGNEQKGMPAFKETFSDADIFKIIEFIKNYNYEENYVMETKKAKDYTVEVVVDGLGIPWGMEFLPNGDLLIAEKSGVLSRFSKSTGLTKISGLPTVRDMGQGGLLDLKLHPEYEKNGWLYISYSYIDEKTTDAGNTAIIRAKIKDNALTEIQTIYKGIPAVSTNHHFGSRMVFDKQGYLYFSIGDRGKHEIYPQKLDNSNGKIHRLNDDGSIPKDNPFVNQEGSLGSIFSYGHRNPQGLTLHPKTGLVWEHEHGPKGGDEINILEKGKNYGWPIISYGINYNGTVLTKLTEKEGMEQPLHYYVPSIAPCGMAFLNSNIYPKWKGNLLIGSLRFQYLERLVLNGTQIIHQEKMLEEIKSRVRNVCVSPDGYIYVAVEEPGRILKILPK